MCFLPSRQKITITRAIMIILIMNKEMETPCKLIQFANTKKGAINKRGLNSFKIAVCSNFKTFLTICQFKSERRKNEKVVV
jgi:hypothetical protein